MADNLFWQYWYFHLPNYLLAVLFYSLLGRFLLSFFVAPGSANYIWRFFRRLTDPLVAAAGFVTPRFIAPFFLPLVTAFWVFLLRHALFVAIYAAGWAPRVTGAAPP
jgi:YggT family protein